MEGVVFDFAAVAIPGNTGNQGAVLSEPTFNMVNNCPGLVLGNGDGGFRPQNDVFVPVPFGHAQIGHDLLFQELRVPLDLLGNIALHGGKAFGFAADVGPADLIQGRGQKPGQQGDRCGYPRSRFSAGQN